MNLDEIVYARWSELLKQDESRVSAPVRNLINKLKQSYLESCQEEMWRLVNRLRKIEGSFHGQLDEIAIKFEIARAMLVEKHYNTAIQLLIEASRLPYQDRVCLALIYCMLGNAYWLAENRKEAFRAWGKTQTIINECLEDNSILNQKSGWLGECSNEVKLKVQELAETVSGETTIPPDGWVNEERKDGAANESGRGTASDRTSWREKVGVNEKEYAKPSPNKRSGRPAKPLLIPGAIRYLEIIDQIPAGEPFSINRLREGFVEFQNLEISGRSYQVYSLHDDPWIKLKRGSEYFTLHVLGDSMDLGGIDNEDYVLIHYQSTAKNGDIVAAVKKGYEDTATLKEFEQTTDSVFLHYRSTKPEYKDRVIEISDPDNELNIWGVVVAVLKPVESNL